MKVIMAWAGHMNMLKVMVEEIVVKEVIYIMRNGTSSKTGWFSLSEKLSENHIIIDKNVIFPTLLYVFR